MKYLRVFLTFLLSVWGVFFVLSLGTSLLGSIVLKLFYVEGFNVELYNIILNFVFNLLQYFGLLLIGRRIARDNGIRLTKKNISGEPQNEPVGISITKKLVLSLVLGVGTIVESFLFFWILESKAIPVPQYEMPKHIALVVTSLLLAPVVEELFFRRLFFAYCEKYGIKFSILLNVFIFALCHHYNFDSYALYSLVFIMVSCFFFLAPSFLYTRSVLVSCILHFLYNGCDVAVRSGLLKANRLFSPSRGWVSYSLLGLSIVGSIAALRRIHRSPNVDS